MTVSGLVQTILWLAALLACVPPLGSYMARVYSDSPPRFVERWLGPVERWVLRMAGVSAPAETTWRQYAHAVLWFSVVSFLGVYLFQRIQGWLPLNPAALSNVAPDLAFNTAMSFVTNTNWQNYGGESTMSYSAQMLALTVQNFASAASGMAVLAALVRGLTRQSVATIGNFWVDLVRGTLYVLLPLSIVFALLLVSQGVVQTFQSYQQVELLEPTTDAEGRPITTQTIAVGPAASQVAIKQLGTNGGGFFNANSAHPFENPTPLSNFLQLLAILLIPAALCHTFGEMVGDRRQGRALLAAMLLLFVPPLFCVMVAEQAGNPTLAGVAVDGMTVDGVPLVGVAVDPSPSDKQPGGNMEGKELRFGIAPSAQWAAATTAASNGSVNSMHDSYGPIGGLVTMWFMQLGEVVFGGVGSGLYGMLVFALVAVFISGLMVGRTPEYLGKKIGAFEMKMAALAILLPCALALLGTAVTVATEAGKATIFNPGPHGFSEALYAYSSAANNNGSAFAGLNGNTPLHNGLLAIAMFGGRFGVMLPVLAIAGSLAAKKSTPAGAGTLPTHTPLFVVLLAAVVIIVGALSFFPALALGPIVEQLQLTRG